MMADRSAQARARRLRGLRGAVCIRAQIGYAGALLLDFGTLREPDACSGDSAATAEHALRACLGMAVLRLTMYRPSYMCKVVLTDGFVLWLFPDAADQGQESNHLPWYVATTQAK